jgi:FHA domain
VRSPALVYLRPCCEIGETRLGATLCLKVAILDESTHHDQEITSVAKRVASLVEPQLTLRLRRRDGEGWLAALNDRRTRQLNARGKHGIPVEGLFDARAVLEALVWDEVGRGLLTVEARRAAANLRQLATLAAHQRPEARRPEAAERAHVLGRLILRAAGIPESALRAPEASAEVADSPQGALDEPTVARASAGSPSQAPPRMPAPDQADEQPGAPRAPLPQPVPTDRCEPPSQPPQLPLPLPAPLSAQLAWRLDPEAEELVLLEPAGRPYLVGRDFDCDVLLDTDLGVSRRHAEVSFEGNGWWVTDLGSKNGTRVGGTPISGRGRLTDGAIVSVGRTDLRFDLLH